MEYLIVGLGNPGKKYEGTRHNIGRIILDNLETRAGWMSKFKGFYLCRDSQIGRTHLLKPETFMNLSGESVQAACNFFKIAPDNVLVVHDEIDIPYGTLAFKKGGGLAGHNGLKSIAACLSNQNFLRLRVGVGRPEFGEVSNWVLTGFSSDEKIYLDDFVKGGVDALQSFMNNGFDRASSEFSKKQFAAGDTNGT